MISRFEANAISPHKMNGNDKNYARIIIYISCVFSIPIQYLY